MIDIRKVSVDSVLSDPDLISLLTEYGREVSFEAGPKPKPDFERYKVLEKSGSFHVLGCYDGNTLIGFMTILVAVLPHWGRMMGVSESYFVSSAYRKTGAGLALLHKGEIFAKELGAEYFLVSAPVGGRLEEVLPHVGYDETNRVFLKAL